MKEENELVLAWIGIGFFIGIILCGFLARSQYATTWNNGVLEGRCLERGGTLHNVDGKNQCVINNNLE